MNRFHAEVFETVNRTFRDAVARCGDQLFLDFSGEQISYRQAGIEVERFARGLHALGVERGDRVVTMLDNSADAVIAWLAINRLGAIHVPVNTGFKGEFLRHQLSDAGARVAVFEPDYVDSVCAVWGELPELKHVLYRGAPLPLQSAHGAVSTMDAHRLEQGEAPFADVAPRDLAALIYTSGTTGPSKGCMVSHNYICDLSRRFAQMIGRQPGELHWAPLPLFHIYAIAIVLSTMQIGGAASLSKKFSVRGFWPEIQRTGAKVVNILGSMATMIANAPDSPESRACHGQVRALLAVPCPPALKQTLRERFGIHSAGLSTYGQTEAGSMVTCPIEVEGTPGSSGRRNEALDVRIFDENDQELPPGAVGEVVVRPLKPHVMFEGYWNRAEASFSLARNYWHHTGDLGKFDEQGFFHFVDRKKDYLRRRGENISSFEVEMSFMKHPAVAEVAVHAVASDVTEDDVKATVVLREGAMVTAAELIRWAVDRVPKFALPRYVEFRNELPKNAVGRVLKYQLRDEAITPSTWDREAADIQTPVK